jgi:hypothetical protein
MSNAKATGLIFGLSLLLALFGAEAVLRIMGLRPLPSAPDLFRYDDTLGWVGIENARSPLREAGISGYYEMNRWGFRDDPPDSCLRRPEKQRLLFLGDSYVMGTGILKEDRVSERVEKADTAFCSFNFGLLGYSTDQELLVLKRFGPLLQPAAVLLFVCANDLIYNDSDLGHRRPKPRFQLEDDGSLQLVNVPVPILTQHRVSNWLQSHSALYAMLLKSFEKLSFLQKSASRRPETESLGIGGMDDRKRDLDSLFLFSEKSNVGDLTYYLLRDFKTECEKLKATPIVFTVPSNAHWTATRSETPAEIRRVIEWCHRLDLPCRDLFPAFREDYQQHGLNLYISDKMHWNARGNEVAAGVVLEALHEYLPQDD